MNPTPDTLSVYVTGRPAPKGSLRHVGGGRMVDQSKKVKPWREQLRAQLRAARPAGVAAWTGPVVVNITVHLARPANHYRTGRHVGILRGDAPTYPTSRRTGDVDKHARVILDELQNVGVYVDDAQVVDVHCRKQYLNDRGASPGARIEVTQLPG